MYTPKHFQQTDISLMQELISNHPFATLVTHSTADGLCANHIPFELQTAHGAYGALCGHVARANPVWKEKAEALVIFKGPDAYITPSWYPSKQQTGKVVPTWNYTVVHAHGQIEAIEDVDWIKAHLQRLTAQQEKNLPQPWALSDAPDDYIANMLKAVVGIRIEITRLEGKWKLSQNKPPQERDGVIVGLREERSTNSLLIADLIESET